MLLLLLIVAIAFAAGAILGAPYLPVLKAEHQALLDMCELKAGDTLLDLGSGDGRLLKAAAKRGYHCIGYEINPFLYLVSRVLTWRERDLITIHLGDYWHITLPEADAIYVFLIDRYMKRLDQKLGRELRKPTVVVSYVFAIPDKKPDMTTRNAFRYRYPAALDD
ncbi:MAG: hypothetical protein ABIS59_02710 [Candidatus Saccharibacteria bacterium]